MIQIALLALLGWFLASLGVAIVIGPCMAERKEVDKNPEGVIAYRVQKNLDQVGRRDRIATDLATRKFQGV